MAANHTRIDGVVEYMENFDIIIKNGDIADPYAGVWRRGNIGISGRRSAGVVSDGLEGRITIDAEGCVVMPGLIDMHTHIFYSGSGISIRPDLLIPMGVTTTADAGSAGCSNYRAFHDTDIRGSAVRIFSYLNVCSFGQPGHGFQEDLDPSLYDSGAIRELLEEYPEIRGLKLRIGREIVGELGLEPLVKTKDLAQKLGVPIVVHISNPPAPESEVVSILDDGDVFCHCFHGKGDYTIIGHDGRALPEVIKARERGVIFDCANGFTNYSHRVARASLECGFEPDVISTDLCKTVLEMDGFGRSLCYVMSKYISLGMHFRSVVRAVTETPARALGMEGRIGTLAPGADGDVTICKIFKARPHYIDNAGGEFYGDTMLTPVMTIKNGEIMYRSEMF